jgi:predicted signal transduction protein with EAL and GGDEF domain
VVTVSIGCATLVPQFGQHADALIELADQALYRAKRSGRNQACNDSDLQCGDPAAMAPDQSILAKSINA